jgi:hypothetical protein
MMMMMMMMVMMMMMMMIMMMMMNQLSGRSRKVNYTVTARPAPSQIGCPPTSVPAAVCQATWLAAAVAAVATASPLAGVEDVGQAIPASAGAPPLSAPRAASARALIRARSACRR